MRINSICIVGGGTSGFLTACYLANKFPQINLTLVESTKIGTIGVGEGTQPYTTKFLRDCGLEPKDWMKDSDATYKLGVEFVGWQSESFFVDNDSTVTHVVGPNKLFHDYWIGKNSKDYFNWLPAYRLAKENKSPKLTPELDFVLGASVIPSEAVHFNANKIINTLKSKVINRIHYIDAEILDVKVNELGIEFLILENYQVSADLYIDCTGFKSLLIEQALNIKHHNINALLPCDKAIAMPTNYLDPTSQCHPYTKSTAMSSGWIWTIPTFGRIGNGYVYSSDFISKDNAELELRNYLQDFKTDALHINMRTGYKEKICEKNVVAVGLSGGFVEPLEATGITFTTKSVEILCNYLESFDFVYDDNVRNNINQVYNSLFKEILAFVHLHYKTNEAKKTEFWQYFDEVPFPEFIKDIVRNFVPYPPNILFKENNFSMFHSGQWFELLMACGQYKEVSSKLSNDEVQYYEIHKEMFKIRTDLEIAKFPNHYDYLKQIYSN